MNRLSLIATMVSLVASSSALATQSVEFRCTGAAGVYKYESTGRVIYGSEGAAQIVNGTVQVFNAARGNAVSGRLPLVQVEDCAGGTASCYRPQGNGNIFVSLAYGNDPAELTIWHRPNGVGEWLSTGCGPVAGSDR